MRVACIVLLLDSAPATPSMNHQQLDRVGLSVMLSICRLMAE